MSVVINTNVDAFKIQGTLTNATSNLSQSMQRMSSGLKINSAKDDAAGTVISARMQVQLDGNKVCQQNIQSGNALLSTTEGNIDVVLSNVERIRDLTLQAKNGTYSNDEISAMQKEVGQRINEIDRIATSAKYSDSYLFKAGESLQANGAKLQVGQNSGNDNVIEANKSIFDEISFSKLTGVTGNFQLNDIAGGSYATFDNALDKLDSAISGLTDRKALIGSAQARLDSALNTLTTQYTNLSSAKSIITDADIASEASNFTQNQILQQVSTSLLAQANQSPSIALSLL